LQNPKLSLIENYNFGLVIFGFRNHFQISKTISESGNLSNNIIGNVFTKITFENVRWNTLRY